MGIENDDDLITLAVNLTESQKELIRKMRACEVDLIETGQLSRHWRNEIMIHLAQTTPSTISKDQLTALLRAEYRALRRMPSIPHRGKSLSEMAKRVYMLRNASFRK